MIIIQTLILFKNFTKLQIIMNQNTMYSTYVQIKMYTKGQP